LDRVDAACKQAPTDRGEHVTDKMIDGPDSVAFNEAKRCLRAQKDMLTWRLAQYDSVSEMYSP
jgi:ornithine carbamoyltransferase